MPRTERIDPLADLVADDLRRDAHRLLGDCQATFLSCRYWHCEAPWEVRTRRIDDSMVIIPVRGRIVVTAAGVDYPLSPGRLVMMSDGVSQAFRLADGCRRAEHIIVHCHVVNTWRQPLIPLFPGPRLDLPDREFWWSQLRRLACCWGHDAELARLVGEGLLRNLLVSLILRGVRLNWPRQELDPRIAAALRTIHNQCDSGLSVRRLAGENQLSEVRFRQLFRRDTGAGPCEYIMRYRMGRACRLLATTPDSVKKIAFASGFRSDHYFHLSFKRAYQCTPSEYRRRQRLPTTV